MFAVYVAAEVIDQSAGLLCNPHKPFPALLTNFNDRRFVGCSALTRPRLGCSIDSHRQSSHTLADLDQGYSNALSGLGNRHHTQDEG